MYRIDSPNNVLVKPAKLDPVNAAGYFNNAPGAAPGTVVTGDFLNTIQEEIAGVIEGASLPLDRTNDHQLLAAIQALVAGVMPTGFRGATTDTVAPAGWIKGSGLTIGNVGSNATERANADTLALFTKYWTNRPDLQLYTSGGAPVARGASAAADWAALRAIATPDYNGRVGIGKDDMAGAAKNRITNAACGIDGTSIGAAGGAQTATLIAANLPPHKHGNAGPNQAIAGSGGGTPVYGSPGNQQTDDGPGTSQPFAIVQPGIIELVIIKL